MSTLLVMPTLTPTMPDAATALISACEGRRYCEFRYVNQKTYNDTPSRMAAKADTEMKGPLDEVKGFLFSADDVFFAKTTGHWCIRVYSMNRQVKGTNGYYSERHNRRTGKNFERKNYLPRTYRLVGIRLETVFVGAGRGGKIRLFNPAVVPNAVNAQGIMV